MEEKDYTFKTIEEVVEELFSLIWGHSVDFTFDVPENETDECWEPTGWYGVKIMDLFNEPHGVLCFGVYGGGYSVRVEEITEPKEVIEIFQRFCNEEVGREVTVLCVSKEYDGH